MRVDTVGQFKILQFIESNFYMDFIKVKAVDSTTFKVTDNDGDCMYFKYLEGKVVGYDESMAERDKNISILDKQ